LFVRTPIALLPTLALLSSCAFDSSTGRFAVRDSAGITVVQTAAPATTWRLSPEPELKIGVIDGDDAYQFSSVAFAGRLSDGGVVVADRQSCEIRFFDRAGRHTTTVGRCGAGPGEFRTYSDVFLSGDTLHVYDGNNRRLSMVGPNGLPVAEQRAQDNPAFAVPGLGRSLIGVAPDGRMVIAMPPEVNPPSTQNSFVYGRDAVVIVISPRRGATVDTIARVAGGEWLYMDAASSPVRPSGSPAAGGWSRHGASFGYYPLYALSPDGLVYATGEHAGFDVIRFTASHRPSTSRIVRRTDVRAVPVGEVADRYAEWIRDLVGPDGGGARDAVSRARAQIAALPRDHHVPFVDEMLADSEGRIWQRDYRMPWAADDSPRAWTVYSPAGQAVGRIVLPGNLRVTQIQADHIVGVTYNEADVSFVTVHRILR
jgi:hypothetical protein